MFQVTESAEIMLETLFGYRDKGAYLLHEFVIMPDHIHLLLTPANETSLERALQLIKGGSSHRIHKQRGGKMEIWQVGFYDWTIRDAEDWEIKAQYIRMNPVRARLVGKPEEWAYSSASGKFCLDAVPERYQTLASGAKTPSFQATAARGLKPPPPEDSEKALTPGAPIRTSGAKAPSPEDRARGAKI